MKGKMMKTTVFATITALTLTLAGCANDSGFSRGTQGAGFGAAAGALAGQAIGRDTEATLLGAAIGTVLGYIVGNEMDKSDRQRLNHIYETAPSGQAVTWQNPDTGNSYQVTPQKAYQDTNSSGPCRRAEIYATIDGQSKRTYTTACRNNMGEWVLQN